MTPDNDVETSSTLLARLAASPCDQVAWGAFVDRYGPRVYDWCKRGGLQDADAEDVTQNLLAKLVVALRTFHYDRSRGRFRGWLRVVTRSAVSDFATARQRVVTGSDTVGALLDAAEAQQDLIARLSEEFDLELLEAVKGRVRLRVAPTTWDSYRLTAEEGVPAPEVAARLGLKDAATVLVNKGRVLMKLKEEIRRLGGGDREEER